VLEIDFDECDVVLIKKIAAPSVFSGVIGKTWGRFQDKK
tara:strand:+ start:388 stop:504 length:117 start_codon:yes stop_codon:yes gene_type:complete